MPLSLARLGRTDLTIARLAFGGMELRGYPPAPDMSPVEVRRLLDTVLDLGINLIDTSIDYGHSEERIGRFLSGRRDEFALASKCGCLAGLSPADPLRPVPHDYGSENVRAGVEQSLRRLRTDHIDLMQVHHSPSHDDLVQNDTLATLERLRDEGKIRFIGISATIPELAAHIDSDDFAAFQIPYSGLQREHEDLISRAASRGAGVLVRGGLARGGPSAPGWRDLPGLPTGESRRRWEGAGLDDLFDGMDPAGFLLRFSLSHPGVHVILAGSGSVSHMRENVRAAEAGPLPEDVYREAARRLAGAGSVPA